MIRFNSRICILYKKVYQIYSYPTLPLRDNFQEQQQHEVHITKFFLLISHFEPHEKKNSAPISLYISSRKSPGRYEPINILHLLSPDYNYYYHPHPCGTQVSSRTIDHARGFNLPCRIIIHQFFFFSINLAKSREKRNYHTAVDIIQLFAGKYCLRIQRKQVRIICTTRRSSNIDAFFEKLRAQVLSTYIYVYLSPNSSQYLPLTLARQSLIQIIHRVADERKRERDVT